MVCFSHVLGAVKFYSPIENVDGFSSLETQFYPQDFDIPIIDRASQAALVGDVDAILEAGILRSGHECVTT